MTFGSSGPRRFTHTCEVSFEAGGQLYGPWLNPLLCLGVSWLWAGLEGSWLGPPAPHVVSPSTGQPGLCTGQSWGESRAHGPPRLCNTHWAIPQPWDELESSCAPLILTPHSVMSGWQLEISHSRRIYTKEVGKCRRSWGRGYAGKSVVPASHWLHLIGQNESRGQARFKGWETNG